MRLYTKSDLPHQRRFDPSRVIQALLPVIVSIFLGCQSGAAPASTPAAGTATVRRVVVLPVADLSALYGANVSVRSPLTGKMFVTDQTGEKAAAVLAELIVARLQAHSSLTVLSPENAQGVMSQVLQWSRSRESMLREVQRIGQLMEVDGVVAAHIFAFRDRVGGDYAATSPARVAFDIQLVLSRNGRIAWKNEFIETQQSLDQNLLKMGQFLKRRGRWVTAAEMAAHALDSVLETFPYP